MYRIKTNVPLPLSLAFESTLTEVIFFVHFQPATAYTKYVIVSIPYMNNTFSTITFVYFTCRLTGFTIPPPVTSSGSIFSLRLTSDFAVSAHGFKAAYEGKENTHHHLASRFDTCVKIL